MTQTRSDNRHYSERPCRWIDALAGIAHGEGLIDVPRKPYLIDYLKAHTSYQKHSYWKNVIYSYRGASKEAWTQVGNLLGIPIPLFVMEESGDGRAHGVKRKPYTQQRVVVPATKEASIKGITGHQVHNATMAKVSYPQPKTETPEPKWVANLSIELACKEITHHFIDLEAVISFLGRTKLKEEDSMRVMMALAKGLRNE